MIKQTQFPDPESSPSEAAAIAADPRGAGVSPAVDGFQQVTEANSPAQLRQKTPERKSTHALETGAKPYRNITAIQVAKLPT
ncbi:MAG: hypothetical protein ACR2IE_07145 [Candidatus Sumerlaeaceae bacterium]